MPATAPALAHVLCCRPLALYACAPQPEATNAFATVGRRPKAKSEARCKEAVWAAQARRGNGRKRSRCSKKGLPFLNTLNVTFYPAPRHIRNGCFRPQARRPCSPNGERHTKGAEAGTYKPMGIPASAPGLCKNWYQCLTNTLKDLCSVPTATLRMYMPSLSELTSMVFEVEFADMLRTCTPWVS